MEHKSKNLVKEPDQIPACLKIIKMRLHSVDNLFY